MPLLIESLVLLLVTFFIGLLVGRMIWRRSAGEY